MLVAPYKHPRLPSAPPPHWKNPSYATVVPPTILVPQRMFLSVHARSDVVRIFQRGGGGGGRGAKLGRGREGREIFENSKSYGIFCALNVIVWQG